MEVANRGSNWSTSSRRSTPRLCYRKLSSPGERMNFARRCRRRFQCHECQTATPINSCLHFSEAFRAVARIEFGVSGAARTGGRDPSRTPHSARDLPDQRLSQGASGGEEASGLISTWGRYFGCPGQRDLWQAEGPYRGASDAQQIAGAHAPGDHWGLPDPSAKPATETFLGEHDRDIPNAAFRTDSPLPFKDRAAGQSGSLRDPGRRRHDREAGQRLLLKCGGSAAGASSQRAGELEENGGFLSFARLN